MCDVRDDCTMPPRHATRAVVRFCGGACTFLPIVPQKPVTGRVACLGALRGGCGLRSDTYPVVNLEWEVGDVQMAGGSVRGGVGMVDAGGEA